MSLYGFLLFDTIHREDLTPYGSTLRDAKSSRFIFVGFFNFRMELEGGGQPVVVSTRPV